VSLDDSVNDMDDAVGGGDIELDDGGGASLGGDGDGLGVPQHSDLLTAGGLEGGGALGHVLGLKEKREKLLPSTQRL
jgi:hypothetical protein